MELKDIFSAKKVNEIVKEASVKGVPRNLWGEFWIENEVCCLFSDSNTGKSVLAVQIGDYISSKVLNSDESVIYYDFELSDVQFNLRYVDPTDGTPYKFSDNFIRAELNGEAVAAYSAEHKIPFEDVLTSAIEENVKANNAKAIIVDNISWLVNMKNSGTTAGKLMMKLCTLKRQYGLSILVLAHTPKRNLGSPITQNSLSGSKTLTNFFDSMFAIAKSIKDPSIRYAKQIKVRTAPFKYDSDHVRLYRIEKDGPMLCFKKCGFSTENEQLGKPRQKSADTSVKKRIIKKGGKIYKSMYRSQLAQNQIDELERMASEVVGSFL